MRTWLRSLLAWRLAYETGVHAYFENGVTGARRVRRTIDYGYQPVNQRWLDGGPWLSDRHPPPFKPAI